MKKISLITAFALGSSTLALAAPSMTGKWSVHRSVSGNEGDSTCSFEQKDKALTGNCKSSDKEISVTGTVDRSQVTWKYDVDYSGTSVTLIYTGTLDDSGKITGTIDVQPYGVSGDFTATPLKDDNK